MSSSQIPRANSKESIHSQKSQQQSKNAKEKEKTPIVVPKLIFFDSDQAISQAVMTSPQGQETYKNPNHSVSQINNREIPDTITDVYLKKSYTSTKQLPERKCSLSITSKSSKSKGQSLQKIDDKSFRADSIRSISNSYLSQQDKQDSLNQSEQQISQNNVSQRENSQILKPKQQDDKQIFKYMDKTTKKPITKDAKPSGSVKNLLKINMMCPIHHQEITQVCVHKDCRDKMFHCQECMNIFANHAANHSPFQSFQQFLNELEEHPHTKRKERIEQLENQNNNSLVSFGEGVEQEKKRISKDIIPMIKKTINSLLDQLQSNLFEQLDRFRDIYSQNSVYLTQYLQKNGLTPQILEQVPSFSNIIDESKKKNDTEFQEYLEWVYRRVLNENAIEQTRQVFAYFEEIFVKFKEQGTSVPQFTGQDDIIQRLKGVFSDVTRQEENLFSSPIDKYPICSSCQKNVEKPNKNIINLQQPLKQVQIDNNHNHSSLELSFDKKPNSIGVTLPPIFKSTSAQSLLKGKKTSPIEILRNITTNNKEKQKQSQPGICKGCRRFYCAECLSQQKCKGCQIELNPLLKSSKFIIKEINGFPVAMLDETAKQQQISLSNSFPLLGSLFQTISPYFKRLNTGLAIGNKIYFSGQILWDVSIENFGQCHSLAFGICKLDTLKEELSIGKEFKEFLDKKGLIMISSNGTASGDLKGRIREFMKEKNPVIFTLSLDFGKNKFQISGKNIYLEYDLENNQGYVPCFFAGCCFRSYNNFSIRQKYSFDSIHS